MVARARWRSMSPTRSPYVIKQGGEISPSPFQDLTDTKFCTLPYPLALLRLRCERARHASVWCRCTRQRRPEIFFIYRQAIDSGRKMCPPALAAAWLGGLHAERLASPKPQAIGNLSGCASTFRGICSGLSADALGLAQFHECLTTLAIAESERPFCPD